MAGQGFALLTPLLWKGDVAAGRLAVPFPDRISARGWAYWLVYPSERKLAPKIKRFREWLVAAKWSAHVEERALMERLQSGRRRPSARSLTVNRQRPQRNSLRDRRASSRLLVESREQR